MSVADSVKNIIAEQLGVEATEATPEASFTEEELAERVNACKEYIAAGDIYQIVLSVLFRGKTNVAPFEVYRITSPEPVAVHVLLRLWRCAGCWFVARGVSSPARRHGRSACRPESRSRAGKRRS